MMKKISNKLTKMDYFIILSIIVCILSIALPSLARYKNRLPIDISTVWDGTVATSYRKGTGTSSDPYVIASGSELAYFAQMLKTNNYENTYFLLSNDIVLNNGIWNYNETNGIEYSISQSTFYIKEYTNEFYDNTNYDGTKIGSINVFSSLDGFKGHFDGNSHTIYGLYITDNIQNELALFTNLEGTVQNLYVENAMIFGGDITAGIASTATNTTLKNIVYNGYIVGKKEEIIHTMDTSISDITISQENPEQQISILKTIPFIKGTVQNTTLTGMCTSSDENATIIINGATNLNCNGQFELELGNTIIDNLQITASSLFETQLTNLKYSISYRSGISSGIVGYANTVSFENIINKSYVYGYEIASGILGLTNHETTINQSYNVGIIESTTLATGLIGQIKNNDETVTISKSYHAGTTTAPNVAGLIGIAQNSTGTISFENTFNATSDYTINMVSNAVISTTQVYYQTGTPVKEGTINGNIDYLTTEQLQDKTTMIANLTYEEFIDFQTLHTNPSSVWVYEDGNYPILYMDDILNPVASLHVGTYSWNTIGYELTTLNFSSSFAFSVEQENEFNPLKEIYYFISNEKEAFTKQQIEEISWTPYENIVEIKEEGFYTIYAKVIDNNDNIIYLNTDLLVLDLSSPVTTITLNDEVWDSSNVIENYTYINQPETITINAIDELSGVNFIQYYITNTAIENITTIEENLWTNYEEPLSISSKGTNIVYVKAVDNCNHVTYVNTNYIIYGGYEEMSLTIGRNTTATIYPALITNQSSIGFQLTYQDTNGYQEGYNHQLISNILFPIHTKIMLFDNKNGKKYVYEIESEEDLYSYNTSCEETNELCEKIATYPFTLFKEVGKGSMDNLFVESSSGDINEDFTIFVDFKDTTISTNYSNLKLYIELHDKNGVPVRSTIQETLKTYNVYLNQNATPYIVNHYTGNTIIYNSNATTNIPIEAGILYQSINQQLIYDTTYENKIIGLAIQLVDENENIVEKKYLKNIRFQVGDKQYSPENDGIVRISLENGLNTFQGNVTVITEIGDNQLPVGNYFLKIYAFASFDGNYTNQLSSTVATIPVLASETFENTYYGFDVLMDEINQILSKKDTAVELNFNILQNGYLNEPIVRISLYKKSQFTAYNQDYALIDLQNYINDSLEKIEENTYYALKTPISYTGTIDTQNLFSLNLNPSKLDNGGYKFVFELYDGTKKIGIIEKKFIVK